MLIRRLQRPATLQRLYGAVRKLETDAVEPAQSSSSSKETGAQLKPAAAAETVRQLKQSSYTVVSPSVRAEGVGSLSAPLEMPYVRAAKSALAFQRDLATVTKKTKWQKRYVSTLLLLVVAAVYGYTVTNIRREETFLDDVEELPNPRDYK